LEKRKEVGSGGERLPKGELIKQKENSRRENDDESENERHGGKRGNKKNMGRTVLRSKGRAWVEKPREEEKSRQESKAPTTTQIERGTNAPPPQTKRAHNCPNSEVKRKSEMSARTDGLTPNY